LCTPEVWPSDVDVADLYDWTLTRLLDERIPFRQFERWPDHQIDVWFDRECPAAKRLTRRLEHRCFSARRRFSSESFPSLQRALDPWCEQRRRYRQLRHSKARSFWRDRIASHQQTDPRRLWRSVDTLLGRGRLSTGSSFTRQS
jgi:hypothetical protein